MLDCAPQGSTGCHCLLDAKLKALRPAWNMTKQVYMLYMMQAILSPSIGGSGGELACLLPQALPPGKWLQKLTPAPGPAAGLPHLQMFWLLPCEPVASTAPRSPQAVQDEGGGTAPHHRCPEPYAAYRLPYELGKGPAGHQMLQGKHEGCLKMVTGKGVTEAAA